MDMTIVAIVTILALVIIGMMAAYGYEESFKSTWEDTWEVEWEDTFDECWNCPEEKPIEEDDDRKTTTEDRKDKKEKKDKKPKKDVGKGKKKGHNK